MLKVAIVQQRIPLLNSLITFLRKLQAVWQDKLVKGLFKNSSYLFLANSSVTTLHLLEVLVLTRFLQKQGYGIYILITTYVMMINQFFDVRIAEAATKYGTEFHTKGDKQEFAALIKLCYSIDFLTGLLAFIIVFFTSSLASRYLMHDTKHYYLINLYALTLLISTVDHTSGALFKIFGKFKWSMVYGITMGIIQIAAILGALLLGYGLVGVIIAFLIKDFISAIVTTSLSFKILKTFLPIRKFIDVNIFQLKDKVKEIIKFIFHTNIVGYFRMVNTKFDVMILGYFRSPQEVGLYKLGIQISSLLLRISDPFYSAILPDLSRLWTSNRFSEFKKFIINITKLLSSIILPFGLIIFIFRTQIIKIFVGNAFLPSSGVISIAIWAFVTSSILFCVWPVAMSMGRPDFGTKCAIMGATTQIVVSLILTPLFGGIGTAVALLITYLSSNLLMLSLNYNNFKKSVIISS